jgi:hypothetical protein
MKRLTFPLTELTSRLATAAGDAWNDSSVWHQSGWLQPLLRHKAEDFGGAASLKASRGHL